MGGRHPSLLLAALTRRVVRSARLDCSVPVATNPAAGRPLDARSRTHQEPNMPRAFITGITGQDGRHLAEFLHGKGYQVYGMVTGQNNPKVGPLLEEMPFIEIIPGDLADLPSLVKALTTAQPDEVYNLGAISFVAMSFNQAELTANITGLGVLRMLEAIRMVGGNENNPIRFYQASSSEMFGKVRETPQTELTPFHPRSPYGCAKVFGHSIVVNYRESYNLYACSGILFNHEGPRRGVEFVTR